MRMFSVKAMSVAGTARNAFWSCAGESANAIIAFFLMPFVVYRLGDTAYGLWVLIGSLTGGFLLLDFGIRGALSRQLAFHRARNDRDSINSTISTAIALLTGACALTLLGVIVLNLVFQRIFDVPEHLSSAVRVALTITGINFGIFFPFSAFDAALWGCERIDRSSQIDIVTALLKAALTVSLLRPEDGLVTLPWITLIGTLVGGVLKIIETFWAYNQLRISHRFVRWSTCREIFGFGFWNFTRSLCDQLIGRTPAIAIGALVSPAAVTAYSIADRLIAFSVAFFNAATSVVIPKSAAYCAVNDGSSQKSLFVRGGRLCLACAVFATCGMSLFGHSLITSWFGGKYDQTSWYLLALALGSIAPLSQSMTRSILVGIARHQRLAIITFAQACVSVAFAVVTASYFGPFGVCVSVACASSMAGIAQAAMGCRTLRVSVWSYVREAVLPGILACSLAVVGGGMLVPYLAKFASVAFILQVIVFTSLFGVPFYLTCIRPYRIAPAMQPSP